MKKCPNCNQLFGDENDFCLNDGSPLTFESQGQATVVFTTPNAVRHEYSSGQATIVNSSIPPILIFAIILVLAMVAVGFGVAFFTSQSKSEVATNSNSSVNSNAAGVPTDEEKKKLENQQAQVNAESARLEEERKKLEAERQKLNRAKQTSGPLPPSTSAVVIDPPTNIRATPNGRIVCVITSRQMIGIISTPSIAEKNGVWYRTNACGGSALVHSSQVSFSY